MLFRFAWLLAAVGLAMRVENTEHQRVVCEASTCTTWNASSPGCACTPFKADAQLVTRSQEVLYNLVQASRYLSDALNRSSSSFLASLYPIKKFKQLKHASLFSATMPDLNFVAGAIENIEVVDNFSSEDVREIGAKGEFLLPAGAFPIMVEVWDRDMTTSTFIGETGVSLVPGTMDYSRALQTNKQHGSAHLKKAKEGSLGTVFFSTDVVIVSTRNCSFDAESTCADITVTVTCEKATEVAKMDHFSESDPFCKVRMKTSDMFSSATYKSPWISSNKNPVWTTGNVFSTTFEGVVLENGRPWAIDYQDMLDQVMSNTRLVAKVTALGGKECSEIPVKSKKQDQICKAFWTQVDDEALSEVTDCLNPEDAAGLSDMQSHAKLANTSSFLQLAIGSDSANRLCYACGAAARRKRAKRSGGSRRYGGNGDGSGASVCIWFAVLVIILILCML